MDLKLDKNKHDMVFVNGDCPMTQGMADSTAQKLSIRLRTFQGEWFRDVTYGTPWFSRVFGKKVSKTTVDIVIQEQIRKEPSVVQITSFESSFDNASREYSCSFKVRTAQGETDNISFSMSEVF